MAKIIPTGKHEAIDLKMLRSEQLLTLDRELADSPEGDIYWLLAVRGRVLQFMKAMTPDRFIPLKPTKKRLTA